jgi:hypothetical protein
MPNNDTHFSGEGHLIEAEIFGDINKTIRSVVCDDEGRLIIDLSSATIDIGTVDQGEPNPDLGDAWPVEITDGTSVLGTVAHPLNVTGTTAFSPSSTTVNIFATADATFGVETTILSYTNTGIKWITQVIGWGQYDGEFLVRINGTIVGGGRTSAADRTLQLDEPFSTISGDVITVTILEYGPGLQNFRANLIGQ